MGAVPLDVNSVFLYLQQDLTQNEVRGTGGCMTEDANVHGDDRLPPAFIHFRDLVRIHLKQILTLDQKPPMNAAALLILVACEALSKLLGRDQEHDVFARDLLSKRGVPYHVGVGLFNALRNG